MRTLKMPLLFLQELLSCELDVDDEVEALYMLAVAQRYGKHTDAALITLATLLDKDRDYSVHIRKQGHAYLTLNKSADATQAFSKAVELNPDCWQVGRLWSSCMKRIGQMQASQVAGQQADFLSQLPPELLSATVLFMGTKSTKLSACAGSFCWSISIMWKRCGYSPKSVSGSTYMTTPNFCWRVVSNSLPIMFVLESIISTS